MKIGIRITVAGLATVCALVFGPAAMRAQQPGQSLRHQIAGTWSLVSVTNFQGANQVAAFGPVPSGMAVFDAGSRFVQILMRPELTKIASNNRLTATPDEVKAIVNGSLAFFGTYTVQGDDDLTLHVLGSTFPNWTGTDQRRTASVKDDELTINSGTPEVGGRTVLVWRRAK